jgi:homoserine kinase type II
VLQHVADGGFAALPKPIATRHGQTFLSYADRLWELTPWLPGRADYLTHPRPGKLVSAMRTLADFHLKAATFPQPDGSPTPSPGLGERVEQLRQYLQQSLQEITAGGHASRWPELEPRARRIAALFFSAAPRLLPAIEQAAERPARLQPCIRDIRPEHLLFEGESVSGIVDFGSLRSESVAADLSRLLGGMVGDDQDGWRLGLQAYHSVRPLDAEEHCLTRAFDQTTVLLSGLNWLRWVYRENRRFENPDQVLARLDAITERLARLA